MSQLLNNPLPPQRPLERHAQIETDCFCDHCGYNLHGQLVTRDPRLGILICRCPECGRFHPAGHRTTAASIWLGRLAAGLLLAWVLALLILTALIVIGFGEIQMAHVYTFTWTWPVAPDGRIVEERMGPDGWHAFYRGTDQPATELGPARFVLPPQGDRNYKPGWSNIMLFLLLSSVLGLATGMLMVVLLWHWKKRRYLWIPLLPLTSAFFLIVSLLLKAEWRPVRGWAAQRILLWALIQAAFVLLGILMGRPIARLLVRMFIPPRPRQHLAFLWRADGKSPPPAIPAN